MSKLVDRLIQRDAYLLGGLFLVIVALVLTYSISAPGSYPVSTADLPPEARRIIAERPGVPLSKEQLRELNEILDRHDPSSGYRMALADLTSGWYWFVLLSVFAAFMALRMRAGGINVGILVGPSVLVLALFVYYGVRGP
jgi:hypothetical protein